MDGYHGGLPDVLSAPWHCLRISGPLTFVILAAYGVGGGGGEPFAPAAPFKYKP